MSYTPEQIYELHKGYADQFTQLTQSGLISAFSALSNSGIYQYTPAGISIKFPDLGNPASPGALPSAPDGVELNELTGLKDKFADIPNPSFGNAPTGGIGSPPTYHAPSTPSSALRSFTAQPPQPVPAYVAPTDPQYLTGYTYTEIPLGTVTKPTLTNPIFDGRKPDDLVIPAAETIITRYEDEQQGHRNMLPAFARETAVAFIAQFAPEYNAVRTKINNAIVNYNGGAGIPSHIEGAIMARANDRASQEFTKAVNTAAENIAKRGFTLPPGALQAVLTQSRAMMGDAVVRASTEVATKNLELEQQNMQFMLKLGEALEEKILDVSTQYLALSIKMDEQAIASAKEIVATYINAYNLQVLVYKAMYEGYAADAAVFKARIDANDSLVRMFDSEIKAELAKSEVNKARVAVLTAMSETNRAMSQAYTAAVQGRLAPIEAAKAGAQVFEAQARGYAAEASAFEARWRAYSAQVEGAIAPIKGYEAQAQGYTAQANAYRAAAEGYAAQVQGLAEQNKSVAVYNEVKIKEYVAIADAKLKELDKQIAQYSAESGVVIEQAKVELEYWRAKANLTFQEYNAALNTTFEYAREQMAVFLGQLNAAINAAQGLAQASNVAGNLAGSALQGLTAMGATFVTSQQ